MTYDIEDLSLGDIHALAKSGKLEKKGSMFSMKFEGKVLGSGEIAVPVSVTAKSFSEGAKTKIEKAGGKCESAAKSTKASAESAEKAN